MIELWHGWMVICVVALPLLLIIGCTMWMERHRSGTRDIGEREVECVDN